MSKYLWYGIIEDVDTVRRIPIGRFWGVSLTDRIYRALLFTVAVEITTGLHAFGHILSGKMVHSAMNELLITATRDVNVYHGDQSLIPGHVHLARSVGGPIFNLFVAGLCSALVTIIAPGFWSALVASLVSTNQFFGFGGFLPLPSLDGEVIWRELLRPIYDRLKMKKV